MEIIFTLNKEIRKVEVPPQMPLLWVIRDVLNLKGTKFGCGQAMCGACTVQVNGEAVRSCSLAAKFAHTKVITTIEGIGTDNQLHPVQQAWLDERVPQCGYCQPGFMMATVCLLEKNPRPTDEDINNSITNICRCGTYFRMRKAIHRAADLYNAKLQEG